MSIKIENFSLPVCNSFRAVVHKDQLCCIVYMLVLSKFLFYFNEYLGEKFEKYLGDIL